MTNPSDRTLYPDEHRFDPPTGWVVYEVKNTKHVLFEHEQTEALLHVEADGMGPLVSFDGPDETFTHGEQTFEDALDIARAFMAAFQMGVQVPQPAADGTPPA